MDDDLSQAAIAYFNNGSSEEQNLAKQFFQAMDVDGSRRVSLEEYSEIFSRYRFNRELFRRVDRNGDGCLDFWEVLTLYYLCRRDTVSCDSCSKLLTGLHFTCVECFDTPSVETFDLCINCYKYKKHTHQHDVFLDSYALYRSRRNNQPPKPSAPAPPNNSRAIQTLSKAMLLYKALDLAVTAASVSSSCTIM